MFLVVVMYVTRSTSVVSAKQHWYWLKLPVEKVVYVSRLLMSVE